MEVHTHPHSPRVKWTHYFWEFLMLFLAVFCGFLAEYQLEHQIERDRARQYIRSFYQDLKIDTATFTRIIAADNNKLSALSGIFRCYDTLTKNWKATSCLIIIERHSRSNNSVVFSNGTLQQLKNAGGYRLLHKDDRDSIIAYDNRVQNYKEYESTIFQQSQDIVRTTFSLLADFKARGFLQSDTEEPDSNQTEIPILFSNDKALLNKYFNDLYRYRTVTEGQKRNMGQLHVKASGLITYFKNKYQLE